MYVVRTHWVSSGQRSIYSPKRNTVQHYVTENVYGHPSEYAIFLCKKEMIEITLFSNM